MLLFVGLGNPGAKHARHRHNIGFMAVEQIAADHGFGPWRTKYQGLISEGRLNSKKILLLKPETYMNRSGQSVGAAARFFRLTPSEIVVFHDEIDLAPGKCRHKVGGGHAGHNGLRSLHSHIGSEYRRVRLGVGHPGHKDRVSAYVLHDFAKADVDWLEPLLQGISDGAPALAADEPDRFMNIVAMHTTPQRSSKSPARNNRPVPRKAVFPDSSTSDSRGMIRKILDRFR